MKQSFKEFYEPDFELLWDNCIFIFDTSVLLDLYRYQKERSDAFVSVFEKIKDRIWLPYYVGYEYHDNRIKVIEESKNLFANFKTKISEQIKTIENELQKDFGKIKDSNKDLVPR